MDAQEAVFDQSQDLAEESNQAFQRLLVEETGGLLRLAKHLLRDEEEARDLVQDALLRAHLALSDFRWECSLKHWVRRILVNLGLKRLRRRQRLRWLIPWLGPSEDLAPAPASSPEEVAQQHEQARALQAALGELSPRQRTVLVLRFVEGMSVSEVAGTMGIGAGTVKTHLVRAVRQVRSLKKFGSGGLR